MLLIGSRAARLHFSDFREAKDWDVVVDEHEYAELSCRLGSPLGDPSADACMFRFEGTFYELKHARHHRLWSAALEHAPEPSEGEFETELPVLGRCRIASPPLLLILKHCFLAYPLHFWRKNLLDYHFLKARIQRVPPKLIELSQLATKTAGELLGHCFEPPENSTLTCAHATRRVKDEARHAALHRRVCAAPGPLVVQPDAWQGFTSHPIEDRRRMMIELLVEETLVVALERLEDSAEHVAAQRVCNWALRMLITQHLPLAWRYFAADHFPQIQAGLEARHWGLSGDAGTEPRLETSLSAPTAPLP